MSDSSIDFNKITTSGPESLRNTQSMWSLPTLPEPESTVWRGHLIPVSMTDQDSILAGTMAIIVDQQRFVIGRSHHANLTLSTIDISREHACIRSSQSVFFLEDLGSKFGTFINDERVLASRLSDGDLIRFGGATAFRFERRAMHAAAPFEELEDVLPRIPQRPTNQMTVTFWGCRGSMPTSGPQTEIYGGNTTSIEIRFQNTIYLIDAGTGIAKFSKHLAREYPDQKLHLRLYFTHLHWDHIQGFPFFSQAYLPDTRLEIFEVHAIRGTIHETLRKQMQGQFFPIPMEAMRARMEFPVMTEQPDSNGLRIRKFLLPHPGGAFAYRFETATESFVFASDCELEQLVENRKEVHGDPSVSRIFPQSVLTFFANADLLVLDCQYSDKMYSNCIGWGHNSVSVVVDFCSQVNPRHLILTHHDPDSNDHQVREILDAVKAGLQRRMGDAAPFVSAAREDMTVFVSPPRPSASPSSAAISG